MIPFPDKKYKTIVIDPPWPIETGFNAKNLHSPMTRVPYSVMSLKEIEGFPIDRFADEDCAIFLWTIQLYLPYSFELLKKWGFKFHCLMTWDKVDGINVWGFTRNSEFVLFAYRGKFNLDTSVKFIPTSFKVKRTSHSAKPDKFFEMIRPLTPEPRISVFERRRRMGFDAWGDQVEAEPITIESFS